MFFSGPPESRFKVYNKVFDFLTQVHLTWKKVECEDNKVDSLPFSPGTFLEFNPPKSCEDYQQLECIDAEILDGEEIIYLCDTYTLPILSSRQPPDFFIKIEDGKCKIEPRMKGIKIVNKAFDEASAVAIWEGDGCKTTSTKILPDHSRINYNIPNS